MELTETIESMNRQLADLFGIDTESTQPMWRIVWANDQYEKRRMDVSPGGIPLLHPEVFEVPKYQVGRDRYILEHLVLVPEMNQRELPTQKKSYEPVWVFQSKKGEYLPPRMDAAIFLVDLVHAALSKIPGRMRKYVEEDVIEAKEKRIQKLQDELFGNETDVGDALTYKEGIVVPGPQKEH